MTKTLGDAIITSSHSLINKIKNKINFFGDEIVCQQKKMLGVTKTLGEETYASPIGFFFLVIENY